MIAKDNGFIEIGFGENAVNGLLYMNEHKRGKNFDIIFLKAMLVDFCSGIEIKIQLNNQKIVNTWYFKRFKEKNMAKSAKNSVETGVPVLKMHLVIAVVVVVDVW